MFRSLQARLWLSYFLLVGSVLCVVTIGLTIYLARNPAALRQAELHLEVVANLFQTTEQRIDRENPSNYQSILQMADKNLSARFMMIDPQGKVIADSRTSTEAPVPSATIKGIINQNLKRAIPQYRDENRKVWIFTVRALQNGMILIASNRRPGFTLVQFFREDFLRTFLRAGVIALLLSLLLAGLTSQWISRPLEKITQATRMTSSGQYIQIPMEGPSEVQALAKSFNDMTNSVQASEKSQRDFIANVSHDLKTPLTSIQGFAQAILDGTADSSEAIHHAAEIIHSEVIRMNLLLLDLLDLARLDSGMVKMKKEPIALKQILETLVAKYSIQAHQAGINLLGEISDLPEIFGDPERLSQAISNILDNALKYSLPGGMVILRAGLHKNIIEITVSDEGPGVTQEDLPHIFERFFQADKSRSNPSRGTGLGLSISREIILAHGGTISAYNNPPESKSTADPSKSIGCTFMIQIPHTRTDTIDTVSTQKSVRDG